MPGLELFGWSYTAGGQPPFVPGLGPLVWSCVTNQGWLSLLSGLGHLVGATVQDKAGHRLCGACRTLGESSVSAKTSCVSGGDRAEVGWVGQVLREMLG